MRAPGRTRSPWREGAHVSLVDKLAAGIERFAEGADKAIDKSKTKVGEIQTELQMDGLAKKLGYLVFDFYRGREVDQVERQRILDELSRLEDKLLQRKAEATAGPEAEAASAAEWTGGTERTTAGAWAAEAGEPGAETSAADGAETVGGHTGVPPEDPQAGV